MKTITLVLIATLMPTLTHAESFLPHEVITVTGTCVKFVAYDDLYKNICNNKLLNSTLKNGRVITQVSTDNGSNHSVLAFAGNAFKFKKIHLKGHADKWVLIQHVDKVDITFAGETDRIEADGQCISDNVFEGKAHISCVADTPQGEFAVFFETDGTKPIIIHP